MNRVEPHLGMSRCEGKNTKTQSKHFSICEQSDGVDSIDGQVGGQKSVQTSEGLKRDDD